jgi:hypothetical protein
MKYRLTKVIECGATTCASEPGKFCQQLRVSHFGTRWSCYEFECAIEPPKDNFEGWLQRCKACLEQAREGC